MQKAATHSQATVGSRPHSGHSRIVFLMWDEIGGGAVKPDMGKDHEARDGWEERAASVLNAVMVMAMGLAMGALGFALLWRVGSTFGTSGGETWPVQFSRLFGVVAVFVGSVLTIRFGAGMWRSRR